MCAVLKTLHSVKNILNEEECRSVGKAGDWWDDELTVVIATKPPGAVQESLGVLEEYKGRRWYARAAKGIRSKLCLGISLCHFSTLLILPPFTDCALYVVKMRQRLVTLILT